MSADVDAGGMHESEAFGLCFGHGEAGEGITAFFEKRPRAAFLVCSRVPALRLPAHPAIPPR